MLVLSSKRQKIQVISFWVLSIVTQKKDCQFEMQEKGCLTCRRPRMKSSLKPSNWSIFFREDRAYCDMPTAAMHNLTQHGLSLHQEAELMQLQQHDHQLWGTLSHFPVKALQHNPSDAAGCANVMHLQLWHTTGTECHGWMWVIYLYAQSCQKSASLLTNQPSNTRMLSTTSACWHAY